MNSTATASGSHADVPITKSVLVAASAERAFQVFTEEMSTWWPLRSHHRGKVEAERVVIEPFVGGRWFERGVDDRECWGTVRAWDPPRRLVLSCEISSDWRHDPSIQTEVDVRFSAEGASTRVDLEHRCFITTAKRLPRCAAFSNRRRVGWGSSRRSQLVPR